MTEHGSGARSAPCLDYRALSHTRVGDGVLGGPAQVVNRARVFRNGEIEVRTLLVRARSRPPVAYRTDDATNRRWCRGVSRRGRRLIRRAVAVKAGESQRACFLYTLTSQGVIGDDDFKAALQRWLGWLRKYAPDVAADYVWVVEPQARGVLHAHVILFGRMPGDVWNRARALWCDRYAMGPGSFDVKRVGARRASGYVSKYLTHHHDADGYRVGRNGEPFVTEHVLGNAYAMSDAMRSRALPVTEFFLPWGAGPELGAVNLRGCVLFFGSVDEAHAALAAALGGGLHGDDG